MSLETKAHKLQEEYELYLRMWCNAMDEEGPESSMALLAQTMVEEVLEELDALAYRVPVEVAGASGYVSVSLAQRSN